MIELPPSVKLTPLQQRLLDILKDGNPHEVTELIPIIDELADKRHLMDNIGRLRSVIYESGYLIAGHSMGKRGVVSYQLVERLRVRLD